MTLEPAVEHRFPAMGTTVHLIAVGTPEPRSLGAVELLELAEARIHDLEAQWSRFRPTSELCRLNARAGTPTTVTPETFALVAAAVDGWHYTGGLFDPTLHDAVAAEGYERTFDELPPDRPGRTLMLAPAPPRSAGIGCAGIVLEPGSLTVRLPAGTRLDLGGIAKGHTADLVVADLAAAGLDGACANVGGDVRVWGRGPTPRAHHAPTWGVDIRDPTDAGAQLARIDLDDGALVTSTRLRRRWLVDGAEHHHLIDPRTGRSAFNGWAQVSVVAGTATEAEILAKAVYLAGPSPELLAAHAACAVLVADDGHVETFGFDDQPCS